MVCKWFGLKTNGMVFSGLASKLVATVCQWFSLKNNGTVFSILASNPVATVFLVWPQNRWWLRVSRFGPQNRRQLHFGDLGLKITATVSWFVSLNQMSDCLSVVPQNQLEDVTPRGTREDLAACFTWKQVGLVFPSLPQNWQRRDGGWCTWHHHEGCV
jgi:hypothetical protein